MGGVALAGVSLGIHDKMPRNNDQLCDPKGERGVDSGSSLILCRHTIPQPFLIDHSQARVLGLSPTTNPDFYLLASQPYPRVFTRLACMYRRKSSFERNTFELADPSSSFQVSKRSV